MFGMERRLNEIEDKSEAAGKYDAAARIYRLLNQHALPSDFRALADSLVAEADRLRSR